MLSLSATCSFIWKSRLRRLFCLGLSLADSNWLPCQKPEALNQINGSLDEHVLVKLTGQNSTYTICHTAPSSTRTNEDVLERQERYRRKGFGVLFYSCVCLLAVFWSDFLKFSFGPGGGGSHL